MDIISGILATAILAGGALALAALGEVLAERVGVVNLGIEGLMALGALSGIVVVSATESPSLGFLAALGTGFLFGLLFATAAVLMRANQVLCGLALTLLGTGLAATLGRPFAGSPAKAVFAPVPIPFLADLAVVGEALFSQNLLVYGIYGILPFALHWLMFKTRHGLNMRAVGENPAAADASGIPVTAIRFWYVVLGSSLAGGAGAYLTLAFVPSWSDGVVAGRGWIALALVIFAGYRPLATVGAALIFGAITALGFVGQVRGWPIAAPVLSMLPYLGTLAFLIVPVVMFRRLKPFFAEPGALGRPYYRDVR